MVHLRSLFTNDDLMHEAEERVLSSYKKKGISSVIWTVTYSCNLRCKHCYENAGEPLNNELNTSEALKVIEELKNIGRPLLFISGGEPLLRSDIYTILSESVKAGMRVILSSNGTLINSEVADRLADTHIHYVTLSLYGPEKFHDRYTRIKGSYRKTLNAFKLLVERGIRVGIKSIVNRETMGYIKYLFGLARDLGINLVYICDFIPVGRGRYIESLKLSNDEWRRVMDMLIDEILLNDYYDGIEIDIGAHPSTAIYTLNKLKDKGIDVSKALEKMSVKRENPVGQGFISISPEGDILLSNFLPNVRLGNVKRDRLEDVVKNPLYRRLGDSDNFKGICEKCQYRHLCGGCRVKAYLEDGDLFAEDSSCLVYR
jgi:radical SAM protein with 4Fe4S-binding SPASM domain